MFFKFSKNASETFQLLKKVYGENFSSKTKILDWFLNFKDGREDVEDDKIHIITENNMDNIDHRNEA